MNLLKSNFELYFGGNKDFVKGSEIHSEKIYQNSDYENQTANSDYRLISIRQEQLIKLNNDKNLKLFADEEKI